MSLALTRTPTFVVKSRRPAAAFESSSYSGGPMGTSPALVMRSPSRATPRFTGSIGHKAFAFADVISSINDRLSGASFIAYRKQRAEMFAVICIQ